jgi:hypothetical protein
MLSQRQKVFVYAAVGVGLAWLLAVSGYFLARSTKVTAEDVRGYLRSVDLSRLSGQARAEALRALAKRLNALSFEERRVARLDREWARWFEAMTDGEKGSFIEATFPTGLKQAVNAFEELPEARRKRAIDEALKRLRQAKEELAAEGDGGFAWQGTNAPPVLSEELRQKVTTLGLRAFYSESSAQTKAELAPLLEELQHFMESGALLRGR